MSYQKSWTHEGRPQLNNPLRSAPDGPWWDEPDKVHWIDEASDLDCLAVRNLFGAWCGYVGLPPGHPLHGAGYEDAEVRGELEVHGGLTFASECRTSDRGEGYGICHTPLPGRPAGVWWLGFDCGHLFDLQPGMDHSPEWPVDEEVYRDLAFVQAETANLAAQLAATPL